MISISVAKLLELYHRIQKTADIILLCATFTVVIKDFSCNSKVFFKCDNYICYDTKIMSQSSDTSIFFSLLPLYDGPNQKLRVAEIM